MYGSDTVGVNSQRFTTPTIAAYRPSSYGQQTTGVPQASPTMPPFLNGAGQGSSGAVYEGVGGYGTSANNLMATSLAAANPHSLKLSPVWWAVIVLLLGLWLLNAVHWRDTVLESASGALDVGPARAEAREET